MYEGHLGFIVNGQNVLSESLFMSNQGQSIGHRMTSVTISRWIKDCIFEAYVAIGLEVPQGIKAHFIRGIAISTVFKGTISLSDMCKAVVWSSVDTFNTHYKIDKWASADASFGRKV